MCSHYKYLNSHFHVWIIRKEKSSFVRSLLKNSPLLMCAQGLLCCICYNFFVFSSFKIFMLKHRKWGFWTGFSFNFQQFILWKIFVLTQSLCYLLYRKDSKLWFYVLEKSSWQMKRNWQVNLIVFGVIVTLFSNWESFLVIKSR